MSIAVNMLMCEVVSFLSEAALIRNFLSRNGTVIFAIFLFNVKGVLNFAECFTSCVEVGMDFLGRKSC
jgi:hypothetical protein